MKITLGFNIAVRPKAGTIAASRWQAIYDNGAHELKAGGRKWPLAARPDRELNYDA
jgi:hypothetical protein